MIEDTLGLLWQITLSSSLQGIPWKSANHLAICGLDFGAHTVPDPAEYLQPGQCHEPYPTAAGYNI